MKKRICLLLTLIISIFVGVKSVEAADTVMWLRCDNPNSDKDWIFYKTSVRNFTELNFQWYFKEDGGKEVYKVRDCWFEDKDNIYDDCLKKDKTYLDGVDKLLSSGTCPANIKTKKSKSGIDHSVFLGGKSTKVVDSAELSEREYIVYSLNSISDVPGNRHKFHVVELYSPDGRYFALTTNDEDLDNYYKPLADMETVSMDTLYHFEDKYPGGIQNAMEERFGKDFFRIGKGFSHTYLANYEYSDDYAHYNCTDYDSCKNLINNEAKDGQNKFYGIYENFEVSFGSGEYLGLLKNKFDEWYNKNITMLDAEKNLVNNNVNASMTTTSEKFNNKSKSTEKYLFGSEYTAEDFLDDLEKFVVEFNKIKVNDNGSRNYKLCDSGKPATYLRSAANCIVYNTLGFFPENAYYVEDKVYDETLDIENIFGYFYSYVLADVNKFFEEKGFNDTVVAVDEYITIFAKSAAYLDKYCVDYGLEDTRTSYVRGLYEKIAIDRGLDIIVDCEGLLGQDLVNKIKEYLNIVKYFIPIILIGFGIFEFTKAIFSGDESIMKKAQVNFFKRIGIAVLIFFVPVIIELILNVANEVWGFISPDTCGLF